jgi:hypothetical protein
MREWRIEHLEPWSAAGPGWSNRGITAHLKGPAFEDDDGVLRERTKIITVYDKDLSAEEHLALSVALKVNGVLHDAIMRAHKKEARR